MGILNIEKRLRLPQELTADTLYLIKNESGVSFYLTDHTATGAYPLTSTEDEIEIEPFFFKGTRSFFSMGEINV